EAGQGAARRGGTLAAAGTGADLESDSAPDRDRTPAPTLAGRVRGGQAGCGRARALDGRGTELRAGGAAEPSQRGGAVGSLFGDDRSGSRRSARRLSTAPRHSRPSPGQPRLGGSTPAGRHTGNRSGGHVGRPRFMRLAAPARKGGQRGGSARSARPRRTASRDRASPATARLGSAADPARSADVHRF